MMDNALTSRLLRDVAQQGAQIEGLEVQDDNGVFFLGASASAPTGEPPHSPSSLWMALETTNMRLYFWVNADTSWKYVALV